MQLVIAAVGHKMPTWVESGFGEYAKRMPPDCRLHLKEIKPVERSGSKTAETAMALGTQRRSKPRCRKVRASSRWTNAARI
jgi:23S rRNA (pseudouridine1915-N3)-methyltransferase